MTVQRDSRIDSLGNDDRSVLVLKEILRDVSLNLSELTEKLGPVLKKVSIPTGGQGVGAAPAPPYFMGAVLPLSIGLTWGVPTPAGHLYEIRRSTELEWDTASFVTRTPSFNATLPPLTAGTYNFLIKTIDTLGNYSPEFDYVTLTVVVPNAPLVTATVIDNNVLLYWTIPFTSHQVDRYNLYKDGNKFGVSSGTFTPIFETLAGTYTYSVEAIDVAGNVGNKGSVTTSVHTPPDFELEDQRLSDLNGQRHNVERLPTTPSLLACVSGYPTWDEHFRLNAWNTIQEQINAGYPIYSQPTEVTGWYDEVIDYITEVNNTIVTINYQLVEHIPTVSMVISLAYSTDNINFSPLVVGNSQFIPKFRYLRMHLDFTASDNKALAEFSLIQVTLDVKRELDSGNILAEKEHDGQGGRPNGTPVLFNKEFKDIDSITATADAIEPIDVIYDFTDVPNPKGFSVFALDTTGNRVTYPISWKARGIV